METTNKPTVWREVTMSISMSKSVMVEVPEDCTDEELKEAGRQNIVPVDETLRFMNNILKSRLGVKSSDAEGWVVDEMEVAI